MFRIPSVPVLLMPLGIAACGGSSTTEPTGEPQTTLTISAGNEQSGFVGDALASPVVVRAARDGIPLAGASITWAVQSGGGSVSSATGTTGADGLASTMWTLGPNSGPNTLQASSAGAIGSPVTFTATGELPSPPPSAASVTVGDFFFEAASTTIAAGGQVTWTWSGSAQHNVTFATGTNSATQTSGTFSRTFADAGTFAYQCSLHPGSMQGTVTVQ